MSTVADIADVLGLDPADVAYVISEYLAIDLHEDELPKPLIGELHDVLNPGSERTVPELYGLAALDWRTDDEPL